MSRMDSWMIISCMSVLLMGTQVHAQDVSNLKREASKDKHYGPCDSGAFIKAAIQIEDTRMERRITEAEFAKIAKEPGTVILDARGADAYRELHIKGSINLPYTDFAAESLRKIIPDKRTRILIYCRNNLWPLPGMKDYPSPKFTSDLDIKLAKGSFAGLNIPTYITLYLYGYENIWELNSYVDANDSPIEFESFTFTLPPNLRLEPSSPPAE